MLLIQRGLAPPAAESGRIKNSRDQLYLQLSSTPVDALRQLRINAGISPGEAIRAALSEMSFGKCAWCESRGGELDIEHYRPKNGLSWSSKGTSQAIQHLYYAWLSLDWENLLPACRICSTIRGNAFPLDGDPAPFLSTVQQCRDAETPLLLDPTVDDPAFHLSFTPDGKCHPMSVRGEATIDILRLNREPLLTGRAAKAEHVFQTVRYLSNKSPLEQGWESLAALVSKTAEYSASNRHALASGLRSVPSIVRDTVLQKTAQILGKDSILSMAPLRAFQQIGFKARWGKFPGKRGLPSLVQSKVGRIQISNFRCLRDVELTFPEEKEDSNASCLVLIGENSVGKSAILEAVALALLGRKRAVPLIRNIGPIISRDRAWSAVAEAASVRLTFTGYDDTKVSFSINTSGEISAPQQSQTVVLAYGPRRFFVRSAERERRHPGDGYRSLFDVEARLQNPEPWLMKCPPSQFNAAVRAIREVMCLPPDARMLRVTRLDGRLGCDIEFHGQSVPLDHLSAGYKTVLAMTVDMTREFLRYYPDLETARGVVIIDEIDLHLHPRWKISILKGLRLAFPRVQFIVSTHDPLVLRGAEFGEIAVVQRGEDSLPSVNQDLPDQSALSIEQLLTSEYFGLLSTEDDETETTRSEYLSTINTDEQVTRSRQNALRNRIAHQLRLGETAASQLIYDAAEQFLRQRFEEFAANKNASAKTAAERISGLFAELSRTWEKNR